MSKGGELPRWFPSVESLGDLQGCLLLAGSMAAGDAHMTGQYGDADLYFIGEAPEWARVKAWGAVDSRIHVAHVGLRNVDKMTHALRVFEARELGRVLAGRDLRHMLPAVTVETLDFADVNDVIAWRLLSLKRALYLDNYDPERLSYLAAKNQLDLGMWLVAQRNLLTAGHSSRIAVLEQKVGGGDALSTLVAWWLENIHSCLDVKKGLLCFSDPRLAAERSALLLERAADLVLTRGVGRPELLDRRARRRVRIAMNMVQQRFPVAEPLRVLMKPHGLLLLALRNARCRDDVTAAENLHTVIFGGAKE